MTIWKYISGLVLFLLFIVLAIGIIVCYYIIKKYIKKKRNKRLIKEQIAQIDAVIKQKKLAKAEELLNKIKAHINDEFQDLQDELKKIEEKLKKLQQEEYTGSKVQEHFKQIKVKNLIEKKIAQLSAVIQQKKLADATELLNEIKTIENNKFHELHEQIKSVEERYIELQYEIEAEERIKVKNLIEKKIAQLSAVIQQKKLADATELLSEIKTLENDKFPELRKQIQSVEESCIELQHEIDAEERFRVENLIEKKIAQIDALIQQEKLADAEELLSEIKTLENDKFPELHKQIGDIEESVVTIKETLDNHINCVKYNIEQRPRNGFYAFYTAPKVGTEIIPHRESKNRLRGYTEESFERKLRSYFRNSTRYTVVGNISIHTSEGNLPYEPDIAIIETSNVFGVRIDIEIDEPYEGIGRTPIHFVGCGDEFRDRNLANLGWIVVRFSEKQIFKEPENCIYFLHQLICQIDQEFTATCFGANPTPDKMWTEIEAKIMIAKRAREILLGHKFGQREIGSRVITTSLTMEEQDVINNAQPLDLPKKYPHNIDKSATRFEQDSHLSFDPAEHIYLYDGRIQLTAVSNVVNQFFKKFDSIEISEKVARRDGISQCEVLEEWDYKGQESREIGTFLHAQIESLLSDKQISMSTRFLYNGEYIKVKKEVFINKEISYLKNFLKENSITPFRVEWHIFDLELNIAGTIDLLCRKGNRFEIFDWKRSSKASPNEPVWQYGVNGLEKVADISFYHYALQQNLYKYILEKNYGIVVENMYIVVLHPAFSNYQLYKIPDMSKEISIIKSTLVKNKLYLR